MLSYSRTYTLFVIFIVRDGPTSLFCFSFGTALFCSSTAASTLPDDIENDAEDIQERGTPDPLFWLTQPIDGTSANWSEVLSRFLHPGISRTVFSKFYVLS